MSVDKLFNGKWTVVMESPDGDCGIVTLQDIRISHGVLSGALVAESARAGDTDLADRIRKTFNL